MKQVPKFTQWVFVFQDGRLHLKIDDEWDEETLFAYNETVPGRAEIQRQWDEYDRKGCPFMSYQSPTDNAVLPAGWIEKGDLEPA